MTQDIIQRIAKIESTFLGFEDHGVLTATLHCNYGGSAQGVGGFVMSTRNQSTGRVEAHPAAGEFVIGILRACGVRQWEHLKGRTIFALFAPDAGWNDQPIGIENLPTEPGERFLFDDWRKLATQASAAHGLRQQ